MPSCEYRVIVDVNSSDEVIEELDGPLIQCCCPYKKRRDTDTPGEPHLITEAETGVMLLQVKECLGILKAKRDKERIFPRSLRENTAVPKPSFWISRPPELLTDKSLLFQAT